MKTAFVTGGSRGIGLAIVKELGRARISSCTHGYQRRGALS